MHIKCKRYSPQKEHSADKAPLSLQNGSNTFLPFLLPFLPKKNNQRKSYKRIRIENNFGQKSEKITCQ